MCLILVICLFEFDIINVLVYPNDFTSSELVMPENQLAIDVNTKSKDH